MGDRLFDKRVDNYFRTENVIFDREDLDPYEKLVYILLCRYANNNNGAFPSYPTIAKGASISRRKAISVVGSLVDKELIEKETRYKLNSKENTSNVYYVLTCEKESSAQYAPPSAQYAPPPSAQYAPPSAQYAPKEELYIKNYSFKKNKLVSQSTGEQTDELTNLLQKARIELYESEELKLVLSQTITDLYTDTKTKETIKKVDVYHITEALRVFREQEQRKEIKNPKLYFKRCLLSAIEEGGLKNLNEVI